MTDMQDGHEDGRRNAVLMLNDSLLDDLDPDRRRALVEALVEIVDSQAAVPDLTAHLVERFEQLGVPQERTVVERMAENIRGADTVLIATDSGRVLHGDPSWSPATIDPDVDDTEDPGHPDRPVWS